MALFPVLVCPRALLHNISLVFVCVYVCYLCHLAFLYWTLNELLPAQSSAARLGKCFENSKGPLRDRSQTRQIDYGYLMIQAIFQALQLYSWGFALIKFFRNKTNGEKHYEVQNDQ